MVMRSAAIESSIIIVYIYQKRRASNWNVCCCLMQGAYDMRGLDDVSDLAINSPCSYLARAVPAHGRSKSERMYARSCKWSIGESCSSIVLSPPLAMRGLELGLCQIKD